jgi:hypothetical protein
MSATTHPVVTDTGRVDSYDSRDQVVAQRAWVALLRRETTLLGALTSRQWNFLADEATRHHLRGVTYRRLADSPFADRVPGPVRERLRSFFLETAGRNAVLFRQTGQMVQELTARGIPVMLLKGLHLSRFVYAEPALRSMADVDIMVPRHQLAEAEEIFLDRGFGPLPRPDVAQWSRWNHHLDKLVRDGAPVMELHWHIQRPGAPFRIEIDGLWQRSQEGVLEGAPVHLLSPEDLLLHLALHTSYQHRFKRAALKGLVDVATVIGADEGLDWAVVVERAAAWQASGYLYTTLRLAADLIAAPVPREALQALPHTAADEEIVEVAQRYVLMLRAEVSSAYLALARGGTLSERMKVVIGALFLPRERMELNYGLRTGSPLVYPAYLLRLATLLWRRSALLFRSFFGTRAMQPTLTRKQDEHRLDRWNAVPPEAV